MCSKSYIASTKTNTLSKYVIIYKSDNMTFDLFGIKIGVFIDCITNN
jgi:hypothetical protein